MSLNSSDLELVYDGSNQQVGLRFSGVAIPKQATITSAYVQFEVDETQSAAADLVVRGQASDNAAAFANANGNISSRPRTAASTTWSPAAWTQVGQVGAAQRTPDLSAVVREIVNRAGWVSGNALVLVVTGTGPAHRPGVRGASGGRRGAARRVRRRSLRRTSRPP